MKTVVDYRRQKHKNEARREAPHVWPLTSVLAEELLNELVAFDIIASPFLVGPQRFPIRI
jgi:hypothetical protein